MPETNIQADHHDDLDTHLNPQELPPNGQHLTLHCLQFAEAFKLEGYEKLEAGLDRLYSENAKPGRYWAKDQDRYKEFLDEARRAFLYGGWVKLEGFVSKAYAKSHKKADIDACVRDLPHGVSSLSFSMFRLLPSMIMLVVRVDYEDSVSNSLNEIMLEQCNERWKRPTTGKIQPATTVKAKKVDAFINRQQRLTEAFIADYCTGEFLSVNGNDNGCKCPSIKLYSLQDIPFAPITKLTYWLKANCRFVQLIGTYPAPFLTYQLDDRYLMFEHNKFWEGGRPRDICILTSESLFKPPEAHYIYGSIADTIRYEYENSFNYFLNLLAIDQVLRAHIGLAIKHRSKLDDYNIDSKSSLENKRKQYSSIYDAKNVVSGDHYDFLRFRQELEYITSAEVEWQLYGEAPTFKLLDNQHKQPDFVRSLVSDMRHLASLLDGFFALLNSRYSTLFESVSSLSNFAVADSTYRYQKQLSILTWALIILTVVMVVLTVVMVVPVITRFMTQ